MTLNCFEHKMWFHRIKLEFQKIVNLLDTTSDDKDLPRFVTKKWIEVYDQKGRNNYSVNKEIKIKTQMLRSDLCNFSDTYIVVKGEITVTEPNEPKRNKVVVFKNNAPFIKCIQNQWCTNWQCRRSRCCNANEQFAWIQQKLKKNNR